ncbi:MAG: hypothetical protein AMXMBFR84_30790 [Candidatus Hydrogenedentota bacterium]
MSTTRFADFPSGSPSSSNERISSYSMKYLDGILRNRDDYFQSIFRNESVGRQILVLVVIVVLLSGFHGLVMGLSTGWLQMLVSAVKVPSLYLITLAVCYPVLYVVNVIMGSHLGFLQTLALILLAMALNAILLASCSPIVLFFTLTGAKYDFLKLLHVAIFGFSGLWAMVGLWRGLEAMCESSSLYPKQAVRIMQVWIVIFAFVGTQVAWSLRPFIGSPDRDFELFRHGVDLNFYEGVVISVFQLLGIH